LDRREELLIAAVAALEEASWEVMGRARVAFIRHFSRVLARELRALGHRDPEEQLHLLFGDNVKIRKGDDEVRVIIRNCPFCVVEDLLKSNAEAIAGDGGTTDAVCVTIGLLEELYDGTVTECRKSEGVCEITVRKEA